MSRPDVLDFLARQRLHGDASFFSISSLARRLNIDFSDVQEQCNQLRAAPFYGLEFRKISRDMEYRLKIEKIKL